MGDLRKALLQLQYLLLSEPSKIFEQSMIAKPSLWQDMQRYLYKPAIKLDRRHNVKKDKKIERSDKQLNDTVFMNSLVDDLDSLSLVSCLVDIEDTILNISEVNTQPSLSLTENLSSYSVSRHLSADLTNFMCDKILYRDAIGGKYTQNQNHMLRKQLNHGVDLVLSRVTNTCLDRRVMAIDYLPTARTICRAEESRSNYKRRNRFFHYLQGLNVPITSLKSHVLTAACKMLQEKIDESASTSSIENVTMD